MRRFLPSAAALAASCGLLLLEPRRALAVDTTDLNSTTPQQLAQLLAGQGITVTNVTFTGPLVAGGSFTGGLADGLGIDAGVILSSGDIVLAKGPNDNTGATGENDTPGDPDLDAIVGEGHHTEDAAVLEFDFVPTQGTASFRYVFASEEYLEFVGLFNDVFAFYVDGVNIALIPGTSTPVAINTINPGSNASFYVDNPTGSGAHATQFDGFTTVLTATVSVTPNVSHHIKLVIADTDDPILDSAVFLEAASFTSAECTIPPPTGLSITPSGNPTGPVTGIDFLDLAWTAPSPAPAFYLFAINGDDVDTTETPSATNLPPRGSNDTITLKVRSACTDALFSAAAQLDVSPTPPTASFAVPDSAVAGTPVTFTDTSDPNATAWLWVFGDGAIATTQSAAHVYAAAGDYAVSLVASNGAGADLETHVLTVTAASGVVAAATQLTRIFDAHDPGRQRLADVRLGEAGPRWLRIQSHDGSHEAILFLRFLDAYGRVVRERRLAVASGQAAAFDLEAYGLAGTFTLELVATERVSASVTEPRRRETRVIRRSGR